VIVDSNFIIVLLNIALSSWLLALSKSEAFILKEIDEINFKY